jgi:polysaccharide biosynthesis transport protein
MFSPLSIARMLWKKKFIILAVWVLLSGIGVTVVWRWPAIYISEALILVDSQKIPEKFVSSTVSSDLQDRLATINQQILSSNRLKKIIDDFGLYREERKAKYEEEVLEMMRGDISVRLVKGWIGNRPGAFRVGFQGPDPGITAQVANRIANLYIEENLKTREVQAEGTSEFIDVQLQEAKKRLDQLEAAVSEYKLKHNGELPEQQNALLGALSGLQVQLEANRDALNRAQQYKVTLELNIQTAEDAREALRQAAAAAGTIPAAAATGARPGISQPARKQSEALEDQLELLRVRLKDQHPDVKRLREDIAKVKALESAKEAEKNGATVPLTASATAAAPQGAQDKPLAESEPAAPTAATQAKPAVPTAAQTLANARLRDLKAQLSVVTTELENRKAEQGRILRDIAASQGKVGRLPVREQEMAGLMRDYEISKTNYKSLLDKKFAAEMSTDMERRQKSERFTIIDPATVPMLPAKPNRLLLGGLAIFCGLLIGVVFAVGNEMRQDVLLGEWELPKGTAIIARLPHFTIPGGDGSVANIKRRRRRFRLSARLAIVFSVVGLLGIAAAGILMSHRF